MRSKFKYVHGLIMVFIQLKTVTATAHRVVSGVAMKIIEKIENEK